MSTEGPSRISPQNQNRPLSDAKTQKETQQKVEKVREVDPDEQTRQRRQKFRMHMGDEDTKTNADTPRVPSPFETSFHQSNPPTSNSVSQCLQNPSPDPSLEQSIVPSPSYSPPPKVDGSLSNTNTKSSHSDDLPHSDGFWSKQDEISTPSVSIPLSEPLKNTNHLTQKSENVAKKRSKLPTDLQIESATSTNKNQNQRPLQTNLPKPTSNTAPNPFESSLLSQKYSNKTPQATSSTSQDQTTPLVQKPMSQNVNQSKETASIFTPIPQIQKQLKEDTQSKQSQIFSSRETKKKSESTEEIKQNILLPPLPAQVQPLAAQAMTSVNPYLNPEYLPLFYQMVGMIYMMTTKTGINKTEFVLNQPNYAGSKFFGSTITIEKYASAPDALNIRLSGSNAAVASFKENLGSLTSAFQNANLPFRIQRIDVEYKPQRPVFQRKEEKKGNKQDLDSNFT